MDPRLRDRDRDRAAAACDAARDQPAPRAAAARGSGPGPAPPESPNILNNLKFLNFLRFRSGTGRIATGTRPPGYNTLIAMSSYTTLAGKPPDGRCTGTSVLRSSAISRRRALTTTLRPATSSMRSSETSLLACTS